MKTKTTLNGLLLIGILSLGNAKAAGPEDPILASFEREMHHQPAPKPRVRRESLLSDPLAGVINAGLWTGSSVADSMNASERQLRSFREPVVASASEAD